MKTKHGELNFAKDIVLNMPHKWSFQRVLSAVHEVNKTVTLQQVKNLVNRQLVKGTVINLVRGTKHTVGIFITAEEKKKLDGPEIKVPGSPTEDVVEKLVIDPDVILDPIVIGTIMYDFMVAQKEKIDELEVLLAKEMYDKKAQVERLTSKIQEKVKTIMRMNDRIAGLNAKTGNNTKYNTPNGITMAEVIGTKAADILRKSVQTSTK